MALSSLNFITLYYSLEPTSYKTALQDPKWLAAMKDEYNALLNNNTWTLTNLPSDRKVIGMSSGSNKTLMVPFSSTKLD
jgi:hypothetical protein